MTARALCLAGKRGSGKTTVASSLEQIGDFARVSFGDFVRSAASARGVGDDIPSLERVGSELITELGWERFCSAVLAEARPAEWVVVDGVRHCAAHDMIRRLVGPGRTALVFVCIDEEIRRQRLAMRGRDGDETLDAEMSDELCQLRGRADLVLDGARGDGAQRVLSWLQSRSFLSS